MIERRTPRYLNFLITIPGGMVDPMRRFNDVSTPQNAFQIFNLREQIKKTNRNKDENQQKLQPT